ncbi:MAG: magnesium transporter CorA family protein [Candidatus Poseidoniaceae archaeon]|jgi:magnesium transporter|nr:magnesium transporter CorA family protein [Candidatus Poseidoniaceae archaeon]
MAEIRLQTTGEGVVPSSEFNLNGLVDSVKGKGSAWLDILRPDDEIKEFLEEIGIDELAIEDIFGHASNTVQRFENHRFIVLRARDADNRLDTEPVAIILRDNLIITVRGTRIPALDVFSRRMKSADKKEVELGIDFLLYELLDSIADDWIPILSKYSNRLDDLEYQVFDPTKSYEGLLENLHDLKRLLREASKSIESLQSSCMRLLKSGERMVDEDTLSLFTDLQQLSTTLVKRCVAYSAGATSTRDTYLSYINMDLVRSNAKLTEVMTTLTIIGAIMLPLTLIAGIFGMNTELPAQLSEIGGFWTIMFGMLGFSVMMLLWFKRKGWLG